MGYVNGICLALSLRLIGSHEDAKARSFVVLGASRSLFFFPDIPFPKFVIASEARQSRVGAVLHWIASLRLQWRVTKIVSYRGYRPLALL